MYYIVQTMKKITIIFKNICKITACGMVSIEKGKATEVALPLMMNS